MGKRVHHVRAVNGKEEKQLRALSGPRTEPYRMVQRAKMIVSMLDDKKLTANQAAQQAGFKSGNSGVCWVTRFNEAGIQGLSVDRSVRLLNRIMDGGARCGFMVRLNRRQVKQK